MIFRDTFLSLRLKRPCIQGGVTPGHDSSLSSLSVKDTESIRLVIQTILLWKCQYCVVCSLAIGRMSNKKYHEQTNIAVGLNSNQWINTVH